ncbi:hypothetical protein H9Q74_009885 [Fusarium xylarioides]|nr:hypothetical protein H9Q71_011071 [Fusarium xylarioides]KAG5818749.1 hypothetical protein H9Q74_009885 [Fusarium xylarioides]
MASASDIITYGGVPLTIIGVMPLIWNFVASLIIFHRLRSSIPDRARGFFKLTLNPVAGSVGCSYFEPQLRITHLQTQMKQSSIDFNTVLLPATQDRWLSSTWMSFLRLNWMLRADQSTYPCKFNVSWAMDCSFIGLKCDWSTFVYIVMALGASPHDPALIALRQEAEERGRWPKELGIKLETIERDIIIDSSASVIARLPNYTLPFSWRRALAWELVMVSTQGTTTMLMPLIPNASAKSLIREEDIYIFSPIGLEANYQREFDNAPDQLTASLTWTLYVEDVHFHSDHDQRETLPVPPQVLTSQREAIQQLKSLSTEEFSTYVKKLLPNDPAAQKEIAEMTLDGPSSIDEWDHSRLRDILVFHRMRQRLFNRYGPHVPANDRPSVPAIDGEDGFLARFALAVSPISSWPTCHWNEGSSYEAERIIKNPLGSLLNKESMSQAPGDLFFS